MTMKTRALILAGGLSSRMGKDKSQLMLNEKTLLSNLQETLAELNVDVLVSGQHDNQLKDLREGFIGPLAGIEAAFNDCNVDHQLLVVPVDMPGLKKTDFKKMVSTLQHCFYENHFLPIKLNVNTFSRQCLSHCLNQKNAKDRSIKKFIERLQNQEEVIELTVDQQCLVNINTPDDFNRFKETLV